MSLSEEKTVASRMTREACFFWFHEVVDLIIQVFDVYIQGHIIPLRLVSKYHDTDEYIRNYGHLLKPYRMNVRKK